MKSLAHHLGERRCGEIEGSSRHGVQPITVLAARAGAPVASSGLDGAVQE